MHQAVSELSVFLSVSVCCERVCVCVYNKETQENANVLVFDLLVRVHLCVRVCVCLRVCVCATEGPVPRPETE